MLAQYTSLSFEQYAVKAIHYSVFLVSTFLLSGIHFKYFQDLRNDKN